LTYCCYGRRITTFGSIPRTDELVKNQIIFDLQVAVVFLPGAINYLRWF